MIQYMTPTRPFTILGLLSVVELALEVGGRGLEGLQRLEGDPRDGQLAVDVLLGEVGEDRLQVLDVLPQLEHLGLREWRREKVDEFVSANSRFVTE